jgi:hypothetical protein
VANYDFKKDLPVARQTEEEVAELLRSIYKAKIEDFCISSQYDIKAIIEGQIYTFEVKEDFYCERTGNVALEFACRGRPSGIQTSKSSHYIYKIHAPSGAIEFYSYKTSILKSMIREHLYFRIVNGGDPHSNSMNYLFKYETFIKKGKLLHSTS